VPRKRPVARDLRPAIVDSGSYAKEAATSPFHFIRRFHAMFGETPHQFRIQARLDRAKHLLAVSDYSVTDVCMEVGCVGVTPSLYRRQVRSSMHVPGMLPAELTPGCLTLMATAFAIFEKQRHAVLADSEPAPAGSGARPRWERIHADQAYEHHGR
jgi:hypothetical protein